MIKQCEWCKKEFSIRPAIIKRGQGKYCSKKCYGSANKTSVIVECSVCKKKFEIEQRRLKLGGKYCSRKCMGIANLGKPSGMTGKKQSEYQKQKAREIMLGNQYSKGNKPNSSSFEKGHKTWNKGIPFSKEVRAKMSASKQNGKNARWKGDKAKYGTIHDWVRTRKGRAREHLCEICNKKQAMDWSNKDHKYKRDLNDWQSLCRKCHYKYDKDNKLK